MPRFWLNGDKLTFMADAGYSDNIASIFSRLREDGKFTDVAIWCQDGKVDAHKFVLANSSELLRNLFQVGPFTEDILCPDFCVADVINAMHLAYTGSPPEEHVAEALAVAQVLRIRHKSDESTSNEGDTEIVEVAPPVIDASLVASATEAVPPALGANPEATKAGQLATEVDQRAVGANPVATEPGPATDAVPPASGADQEAMNAGPSATTVDLPAFAPDQMATKAGPPAVAANSVVTEPGPSATDAGDLAFEVDPQAIKAELTDVLGDPSIAIADLDADVFEAFGELDFPDDMLQIGDGQTNQSEVQEPDRVDPNSTGVELGQASASRPIPRLECPDCGKKFLMTIALNKHRLRFHKTASNGSPDATRDPPEVPFECLECEKQILASEMETHSCDRPKAASAPGRKPVEAGNCSHHQFASEGRKNQPGRFGA